MVSRTGDDGDRDCGERELGEGQTSRRSVVDGPGGVSGQFRLPWDRNRLKGCLMGRPSVFRLIRLCVLLPSHLFSIFQLYNILLMHKFFVDKKALLKMLIRRVLKISL